MIGGTLPDGRAGARTYTVTDEVHNTAFTSQQMELSRRLGSIFMPHYMKQLAKHFKGQDHARFVHYTSAESALNIIRSKRLWMRNTNCMADYREVQHGFDILGRFFEDDSRYKAFTTALDACAPGAASNALNRFVQVRKDIRFDTYIASISEHDADEDSHGRLSMWRAFGGSTTRVGLVLNVPLLSTATVPLNLLFSSVAYLSENAAHDVLLEVIENVTANCEFLRTLDQSVVTTAIFAMFVAGVVCLKHEGFREEREWRVIYSPKRAPATLMESSTEVVGGVPQFVYKIPLDATASGSIADLDFARLFDRLIIGPSSYPWPMYEAFVAALKLAGIADAESRVVASEIPIRST